MHANNHNTRQVLRARAEALARPLAAVDQSRSAFEFVEFTLANERYAVENQWVEEVCPFKDLTPLPCVPPFISGIVNVRGRILAVLNLKKFFDLPEKGITDLHRIILIHGDGVEFGLLADTVTGVRSLPSQSIQPAPATLGGIRGEYLKGVTAEQMVVLDITRLVADPRIIVLDELKN
jgi:purine-binding chemotaxis protein CheW